MMGLFKEDIFVCIDCETTGLDVRNDKIIEIAAVKFQDNKIIKSFETLIDPQCKIPLESQQIHNISQDMVENKPLIKEILPSFLEFIGHYTIVGHGINFDIDLIANAAKNLSIPCHIKATPFLDTLRLARLYGKCPVNSLEMLRKHFNIEEEGAHRAMNDVLVNIKVFKFLASGYKTTNQIINRLKSPISLERMPLGKHKGRKFEEIPIEYLYWALKKDFDMDLIFSIKKAIRNRKNRNSFNQSANPFSSL
jgi:DNA polymerase III subunit epsilon